MFPLSLLLFGLAFVVQYIMATDVILSDIMLTGKHINQSNHEKVMVAPEEMNYYALLYNAILEMYFCGGTLLSSPYILTAAECVVDRQREEIRVHAGRKSLNQTNWYVRQIREIIIHDEYDPLKKWHNDIALLRLTSSFPPNIQFGFVPNHYEIENLKQQKRPLRVRVAGYGIISENEKPTSDQMLKADSFLFSWTVCKQLYLNIPYNISNTVICAFDKQNDNRTRISDVGSPLIYKLNKAIGIALSTNFGVLNLGSFTSPYPLLFTNTSLYTSWIISQIQERFSSDIYR